MTELLGLWLSGFPKKVFHLRKRQKAYTYELKLEIDARARRVAARVHSRAQVEREARKLRAQLARAGWHEAVTPWLGRPFLNVVEEYFKNLVSDLMTARRRKRGKKVEGKKEEGKKEG